MFDGKLESNHYLSFEDQQNVLQLYHNAASLVRHIYPYIVSTSTMTIFRCPVCAIHFKGFSRGIGSIEKGENKKLSIIRNECLKESLLVCNRREKKH